MKREPGWVYGTKVTDRNGEAWGGFQWPDSGVVECPDWNPEPVCGGGLHFFEDGCGDLTAAGYGISPNTQWRLVRARDEDVVRLDGKVKARSVEVLLCGDRATVCGEMSRLAPGRGVHFGTATSGNRGTSTSGDYGTSTSGDYGTATSGSYGTSTSGNGGTSTSGYHGTSTSGGYGTSTSGNGGTSTSGGYGTSTSGNGGTSTSGYHGTATSGEGGIIQIKHWDGHRLRMVTGYVGENGIKPNTPYRLDADGNFVPAGN